MKEKILALLEPKFVGVRKDGLTQLAGSLALTVSTDEEATAVVGKLTADGVNKFISDWRKEADAEIEKANQTRESNLRKKYEFVEKTDGNPPAPTGGTANPAGTIDVATIQKVVAEAVKTATDSLQVEITKLKGTAINADRREELLKVFDDKLPDSYKNAIIDGFENRQFDDAEAFNEFLTKTRENISAFKQELANNDLSHHEKPILGKPNSDGVSSGVADYIKTKEAEAEGKGNLGGKEL